MKALDEYILMVVLTSLLNRVHVFANFMVNLNRETVKGLTVLLVTVILVDKLDHDGFTKQQ